jgi:hypothetical protein
LCLEIADFAPLPTVASGVNFAVWSFFYLPNGKSALANPV